MENQSKVIVIGRNKFAALVKSHRKCIQMLDILTYIYTIKQINLTLTLQEICDVLQMTPEWKIQCKMPPKTRMILSPENIQ